MEHDQVSIPGIHNEAHKHHACKSEHLAEIDPLLYSQLYIYPYVDVVAAAVQKIWEDGQVYSEMVTTKNGTIIVLKYTPKLCQL